MSDASVNYELAAAEAVAHRLVEILSPGAERIEIAGSVRRKRPVVHDLELLVQPRWEPTALFGDDRRVSLLNPILNNLVHDGWLEAVQGGEVQQRYRIPHRDGLTLELYIVHDPDTWGVQLAIRTGPAAWSRSLVTPRRKSGWLPDAYVFDRNRGKPWRLYERETGGSGHPDMVGASSCGGEPAYLPMPEEEDFLILCLGEWVAPELRDRYRAGDRAQEASVGRQVHRDVPGPKPDAELVSALRKLLEGTWMRGRDNARTSDAIAKQLDLPSSRTNEAIRAAFKSLLVEGVPVVSCSKGFYLATSPDDVRQMLENQQARMKGLQRNVEALRQIMDSWEAA